MQTIIMTVGTSLRTNSDRNLPDEKKRPWVNHPDQFEDKRIFSSPDNPLEWIKTADQEIISAETNTLWRLDPQDDDHILLLHSSTSSGQECAEILQVYFKEIIGQNNVEIEQLPNIDYEIEEYGSPLEKMAELLREKIYVAQSIGTVTLAATGGFKAQTMIMGLIGNALGVPVCYIHEAYDVLIYLPYIDISGKPKNQEFKANLPESGRSRNDVIKVQADKQGHHRPKTWKKVEKLLRDIHPTFSR